MNIFSIVCYGFAGLFSALFLGFLSHGFPNLYPVLALFAAAIAALFICNGLEQSTSFVHYGGINPILLNFLLRAIVVLSIVGMVFAIGHWLYVPELSPEAIDEFAL